MADPVRRLLIPFALLLLPTSLIAVWWFGLQSTSEDMESGVEIELGAIVVDDDRNSVGRIDLSMSPAATGPNTIQAHVDPRLSDLGVDSVDVQVTSLTTGDIWLLDNLTIDEEGWSHPDTIEIPSDDYLQVDVFARILNAVWPLATFIVILPDPNVHGFDAFESQYTEPDAERLYQKGMESLTSLHRVRYVQPLSDGLGAAVTSYREVNDGSDGSNPGFTYYTPDGLEAVVVGTDLWSRMPGDEWTVREGNPVIPPSEWGEEYSESTAFALGPVLTLPAGECRVVTFVAPPVERRAIAWYAWCIDEETGEVLRDGMIARNHYMITDYSDFDGDIVIQAPE